MKKIILIFLMEVLFIVATMILCVSCDKEDLGGSPDSLFGILHNGSNYEVTEANVPDWQGLGVYCVLANGDLQLLNAVIDYIGQNISLISDLSFIEAVFHYSNSHMNRIFRKTLGVSVWQYITAKRLDLAFNLIAEGFSAKSAAVRCGFTDYSVFYKSFLKHFGKPPSAFKSEASKKERIKTE